MRSKAEIQWSLQWGKDEAYLQELAEEGRDVPALERRPTLTGIQTAAVEAFWILSEGRPVISGMAGAMPGALPSIDIVVVAEAYGLETDWFLRMVRVMDRVYLTHHYDDRRSKEKKKPPRR